MRSLTWHLHLAVPAIDKVAAVQTLGIFSNAYRRLFGIHFGGFKRQLDVVRSGNLAGLDKQHSATHDHLDTPSEDSPDESGDVQELRRSPPREISLVPMGSTFSDDFDDVPRASFRSPLRSYTLEVGHEHGGALRQLRSLRSTLSAAIDSYKSNKDLADQPSGGDENEQTRRFNDPGMVWVRGCSCQVRLRLLVTSS